MEMNDPLPNGSLDSLLRDASRTIRYPPTPDLWRGVEAARFGSLTLRASPRKLAIGAAFTLVLAILALSVPSVRAAVVEFIRLGSVWIFPQEISPPDLEGADPLPGRQPSLTSLDQLSGETDLAGAEAGLGASILLPSYPPGIPEPDHIYLQTIEGPFVVLVWESPERSDFAAMSLHILSPQTFLGKTAPEVVVETEVFGGPALWIRGEHWMYIKDGDVETTELVRLVSGNVLVWEEDGLTYRLETSLPLEEAIRIAESTSPGNR